jgi:hypothetical protein
MLLAAKINVEMNSDEQTILLYKLQSELTTVGFGTFIVNCNKSVVTV